MTVCAACNGTGHSPEPETLAGIAVLLRSFVTRIDTELGELRDDLVAIDAKVAYVVGAVGITQRVS